MENADGIQQPMPINNIGVVTHQPPPSYDQTKIQTGQIYYPPPQAPVYLQQNGQIIAVPYGINGPQFPMAAQGTAKTADYLNTIWSVFNTCCCLWPVGILALVISILTLRKRRRGDHKGAKIFGISTAVLNLLATIGGIVLLIVYFIPLIKEHNKS